MAFFLSGGLQDAPSPTSMRPRRMGVGNGNHRGGAMTTMFVPQQHARVLGACDAMALRRQAQTVHESSGMHGVAPIDSAVVVHEHNDSDGDDAEAIAYATPHEDHLDVGIEVHSHDHVEEHDEQAEEHFVVQQQPSSSVVSAQKTLEFHTSDKLLYAIEAHRKPILQAFVVGDLNVVRQHLANVLRELNWPHVHLDHHHTHWSVTRVGVVDERASYMRGTMPVSGGDIQVLYSAESLKPHTRIAQLCGWLLPWGAYESLTAIKWRTPSSSHSTKTQGGADAAAEGESKREKGACHSGRSRGRGFSLQKSVMFERVHGGSQYALWMLDDPNDVVVAEGTVTTEQQCEDLYSLQRAFIARGRSNEHCNVDLVHELDCDGRELTWLEINQHVPPETLLCADLSDFYTNGS
jgi:hypothetical protein